MIDESMCKTPNLSREIIAHNKENKKLKKERNFLKNKKCFHSRKLFVLIDNDKSVEHLKYLENHFLECEDCQEHYNNLLKIKNILDENIPLQKLDQKMQESYNRELREIMSLLKTSVGKKPFRNNIMGFIQKIFN